ncbi:hypothetical protein [Oceanobacillus picturae]|uniref:hypothetical protein n=1 Tax=Oceanobacillus picturae TaxID=171693 RepID=UPI00073DA906|nr:hypothetical protein [Oceanobacillus picturae]
MLSIDKLKIINPAAGTIVMAIGIFLFSAMDAFGLQEGLRIVLVMAFFMLGMVIYTLLTVQIFRKGFFYSFIHNPVNSFLVGSWIAGIAIICDVVMKYFPKFYLITQLIAVINSLIWICFVILCIYHFKQLFKKYHVYTIHGVLLLSAVATQSVVISWFQAFSRVPLPLVVFMVSLGFSFYVVGVVFISLCYIASTWTLADDWANTNCILHGALSITGLALVFSQFLSSSFMTVFWVIVFIIFIFVEGIEIGRAISRITKYGWKKGIFTYHISQWSRNFTFGMFYAFTLALHSALSEGSLLYRLQSVFLQVWAWVVLGLLVVEIVLWVGARFQREKLLEKSSV